MRLPSSKREEFRFSKNAVRIVRRLVDNELDQHTDRLVDLLWKFLPTVWLHPVTRAIFALLLASTAVYVGMLYGLGLDVPVLIDPGQLMGPVLTIGTVVLVFISTWMLLAQFFFGALAEIVRRLVAAQAASKGLSVWWKRGWAFVGKHSPLIAVTSAPFVIIGGGVVLFVLNSFWPAAALTLLGVTLTAAGLFTVNRGFALLLASFLLLAVGQLAGFWWVANLRYNGSPIAIELPNKNSVGLILLGRGSDGLIGFEECERDLLYIPLTDVSRIKFKAPATSCLPTSQN